MESSKLVHLDIGGKKYTTSLSTVTFFPESFLANLVSGRMSSITVDESIFIDRDGHLFRHVLNYLRNPTTWTPPENVDITELTRESDFYCLEGMTEILRKSIKKEDLPETIKLRHQHPVVRVVLTPINFKWGVHTYKFPEWGTKELLDVGLRDAYNHFSEMIMKFHNAGYRIKSTIVDSKDVITCYMESKD